MSGPEHADPDRALRSRTSAVAAAVGDPDVPMETWRSAVDDLEEGYRAGRYRLGPVHAARAWLADAVDDADERDRQLSRWLEEPRDAMSGCPACEVRSQATLARRSDPGWALDLLTPVVSGDLACAHEPAGCLALRADLLARRGDLDAAAETFRRAWPDLAEDRSAASAVAEALGVLVIVGNTDRAVDLLLPRLEWLEHLQRPSERMWCTATAAWVLHHGRRLGMAPDLVDGSSTAEVQDRLARMAEDLAHRFDARAGTTAASELLLTTFHGAVVTDEPTLPPTRLPTTSVGPAPGAPSPRTGPEVLALADRVVHARRQLEPGIEIALQGWLGSREAVVPVLSNPPEWAAAAFLDRVSAFVLRDVHAERRALSRCVDLAERGGDPTGAAHARADLAVLDVRDALLAEGPTSVAVARARAQVRSAAQALAEAGEREAAADVWRWYAVTTRPEDAVEVLTTAADLYAGLGLTRRRALCLLDAAPSALGSDHGRALAVVEEAERIAGEHPPIRSSACAVRARMARAAGDVATATRRYGEALDAAGPTDSARLPVLFELCDLLVEAADWERLEPRAADALAVSTRLRDPVALAVAQRHLGLAWVETGRPLEAAELLVAALPVVGQHVPDLVGPTAWALGNAELGLGAWSAARAAFTTSSRGFEASGRLTEAAHARYRAGMAAWDAEELDAAAVHLEHAADAARASGTVDILFAAARARAALRAVEDLDLGLGELDAVTAQVTRVAREHGHGEETFDAEEHEPDILRQGAHLLADAGRTDEAVSRLARARALVGGRFEIVLRADAGRVLAEADRLQDAESLLASALVDLRAAGLEEDRVDAAASLARALERAGRLEEAERVWAEFGPSA